MIAHIRSCDYEIQSVEEHSNSVKQLAGLFGDKAGFSAMASLAGFLHDMGKNTEAFSTYIRKVVLESKQSLERIDHSTAGAKFLYESYYKNIPKTNEDLMINLVVEIVGMVILSHHSGLQNFVQVDGQISDYFRRVVKKELPYYKEVKDVFLKQPSNKQKTEQLFEESINEMREFITKIDAKNKKYNHLSFPRLVILSIAMKYIFSCLIDADRTDTRRFEENDTTKIPHDYQSYFQNSGHLLEQQLERWAKQQDQNQPINTLRTKMSDQCYRLAEKPSSIYTLSIPTGGGKTLASLRYALKHAQLYKKDRIIYIVPYTTIIEQNVDAVRRIVEEDFSPETSYILEHHSNVSDYIEGNDENDYYSSPRRKQIELAKDNWDYPIIFTTMVQFLDAFYAKGTRKARRLHNLTNAVIIFDEVQSVPIKHLPLFNSAVNFLHYFGKSSILLCTATQPTLAQTSYPLLLEDDIEMVEQLPNIVQAFERVKIINNMTARGWNAQEISEFAIRKLENNNSLLIILNTKKAVLNVYKQIQKESNLNVFHLSTSMCPEHRNSILKDVNKTLKTNQGKTIVVSTQLIEAGVDISFECVIRSLSGLDSLAQAAGRCNRNKEKILGEVHLIRANEENLNKLPEIALGQRIMEEQILIHKKLSEDLLSPNTIKTYFDFFLKTAERELNLVDKNLNIPLIDLINHNQKYMAAIPDSNQKTLMRSMFKTLESHFSVIDAPTTGLIVPYGDEGKHLIAALNENIEDYKKLDRLLKKAQRYSVNVYQHTLQQLVKENLIYPLHQEGVFALQEKAYDGTYGISIEGEGNLNSIIF